MAYAVANEDANMTPMPRKRFIPSTTAATLYARYKEARDTEVKLKDPVREQAVQDLHAGATGSELAKLTGLTPEYFRRIARDEGIERLRPPTVGRLTHDE